MTISACQLDQQQQAYRPGSGGTGVEITRHDGVYVTGIVESVSADTLQVNDQVWHITEQTQKTPLDQQVRVGHVVYLRATSDHFIIQQWLRPQAQGVVEWVDDQSKTFSIEGVQISWSDQTLWSEAIDMIRQGETLTVFGEITQSHIKATRIEKSSVIDQPILLTLRLDEIDSTQHLIIKNHHRYLYQAFLSETLLAKFNQCIHVNLVPHQPSISDEPYVISSFEQDQGLRTNALALIQGEVEGMKTSDVFDVGCYRVYTNDATTWEKIKPQSLNNGQAVRVEGLIRDNGALQAVYIWPVDAIKKPSH
jgi:hypothetical protein